jgi:hypothetical protein
MHAERSDCPCPALALESERSVMLVLLSSEHTPWSRAELTRELSGSRGEPLDLGPAIDGLYGAGLLRVHGELVYPSRAARLMDELLAFCI